MGLNKFLLIGVLSLENSILPGELSLPNRYFSALNSVIFNGHWSRRFRRIIRGKMLLLYLIYPYPLLFTFDNTCNKTRGAQQKHFLSPRRSNSVCRSPLSTLSIDLFSLRRFCPSTDSFAEVFPLLRICCGGWILLSSPYYSLCCSLVPPYVKGKFKCFETYSVQRHFLTIKFTRVNCRFSFARVYCVG